METCTNTKIDAFVFHVPNEPYLIVKCTAFQYQPGSLGCMMLKQGYPIDLSEPWTEIRRIGRRTFAKRENTLYDISEVAHLKINTPM